MPRMSSEDWNELDLGPVSDAPSIGRVLGGSSAQAGGKHFEAELGSMHAAYEGAGVAKIWQLPVETQPMPRSWLRQAQQGGIARILSARQLCDYTGYLMGSGRAVIMEAKATKAEERSMAIVKAGTNGAGLKEHQLKALSQAAQYGALSCLVWRNGPNDLLIRGDLLVSLWQEFRIGTVKRIDKSLGRPVAASRGRLGSPAGLPDWLESAL